RGARGQRGAAVDDVADVGGVDALDVLVGVDEPLHAVRVHARGQVQVEHHRVDIVLAREEQDAPGDVVVDGGGAEEVELVVDAELLTGLGLVVGVDTAGRIARVNQDGVEADFSAAGADGFDARAEVFTEGSGEVDAVDDLG